MPKNFINLKVNCDPGVAFKNVPDMDIILCVVTFWLIIPYALVKP